MSSNPDEQIRRLGFVDATSIGVGAIVGGGVLALAGVAMSATGPSAAVAFGLNGIIALVTALSFAELSTAFPRSGGTYLFAKRVLTVGAAFYVGWVVWFASIVAAALYAIGFATFLLDGLAALWPAAPVWITGRTVVSVVSLATTVVCTLQVTRRPGSGGNLMNLLKVVVFLLLILGGLYAWWRDNPPAVERLTPFLPAGPGGLLTAMGYTFIALQGFDLVAAVAGEVKRPRQNLPRAKFLSLGIALLIYLPLLGLIAVAGAPAGGNLADFVAANPNTIIARAAQTFLGPVGFWLVMVAGLLSMFSALFANLFAAARISQVMARDRTLPPQLERDHPRRQTPVIAGWVTAAIAGLLMLVAGDIGRAGAASSLIFLVTFALVHGICVLARLRRPEHTGFRVPWFPVLPVLGGLACAALAVFQGAAVPAAGAIVTVWLLAGFFFYIWVFEGRARVLDAAVETSDPVLLELRGHRPLVLVPIANPDNAAVMAFLGACVAPPRVGRVLLLNVATLSDDPSHDEMQLDTATRILRQSMGTAMRMGVQVECLATASASPWEAIERVAHDHHCASVLLGTAGLGDPETRSRLEGLSDRLPGNIIILRASAHWQPVEVRRVLIPVGGRVVHNVLRARIIGGLKGRADTTPAFSYLLVLPSETPEERATQSQDLWRELAREESGSAAEVQVVRSDDVVTEIAAAAAGADLLLLGFSRARRRHNAFGAVVTRVVEQVDTPVMIIGQAD